MAKHEEGSSRKPVKRSKNQFLAEERKDKILMRMETKTKIKEMQKAENKQLKDKQ